MGNSATYESVETTPWEGTFDFKAAGCDEIPLYELKDQLDLGDIVSSVEWPKTYGGEYPTKVKALVPKSFPKVKLGTVANFAHDRGYESEIFIIAWNGTGSAKIDRNLSREILEDAGWNTNKEDRPRLALAYLLEIEYMGEGLSYLEEANKGFKISGAPKFHPACCRIMKDGSILWLMWFHYTGSMRPVSIYVRKCFKFSAEGEYEGTFEPWSIHFQTDTHPITKVKNGPFWRDAKSGLVARDPFAFPDLNIVNRTTE